MDPWPRFWKKFGAWLQRVIPADARNTGIAPALRGKVPGYMDGGRWVPTTGPMAERRMTEAEAQQGHRTRAAIGILGAGYPGLDIDVDDPILVRQIIGLAKLVLGDAPCRGRENAARCLLMYEGQGIRKRRVEFTAAAVGETRGGAVEWLGTGQYYNLHGLHRSGVPYTWDADPCDAALSTVTNDMAGAFWTDLLGLLERRGRVVRRVLHSGASGVRRPIGDSLIAAPDPSMVLRALAAYPCSIEHFGHRDEIVPFLCGVKAALGTAHEHYRPDVLDWFRKSPLYADDDYFDTIWDSIHDSELDWEWLDRITGAGIGAQTDYTEAPEAAASMDPRKAAIESMLARFRYARKQSMFVDIETGETLNPGNFCTRNTDVAPCGTSGKKAAHNVFFNHPRAGNHTGLTYRPGQELIVDDEINIWRPSGSAPVEGDASPWLAHVAELIPNEAQREHFLSWMAFVLQRPGIKINHAIVLYTVEQGMGKDTALAPLRAGVGDRNYKTTTPEELIAVHSRYLEAQVIYVSEMKNFNKGEIANLLKRQIARPPDTVLLRLMFQDMVEIPNTQCWIFTTNAGDAITIERSDRRYWVPTCVGHSSEDVAYYGRLWHWLEHEKGQEISIGWLLKRDISRFSPYDAPMTQAKQDMIDLATPAGVQFLESQFEPGGKLHERQHIISMELRQLLNDDFGAAPVRDVHLVEILQRQGFRKALGKHWIEGNARYIWTKLDPETMATGDISMAARLKADQRRKS